jgi:LPS-assembly protein
MKPVNKILLLSQLIFFATNNSALSKDKSTQNNQQPLSILKANNISGDQVTNVVTATGNAELTRGNSAVFADKMSYDKNSNIIKAAGNVRIKNIEIGKARASEAEVSQDLSTATFINSTIFLDDGSYLKSPKINHISKTKTILQNPIYSICPNAQIAEDNDAAGLKRDLFTITSKQTTINKDDDTIELNGPIIKLYNVPFFYSPYYYLPIPNGKRKSGFLRPEYLKSSNLGTGIGIPYYLNISENKDLTFTPKIYLGNDNFLLNTEFRHLVDSGSYKINLEIANNEIKTNNDKTVINRTKADYRYLLKTNGSFEYGKNIGLNFDVNNTGDRNYYRDYHNNSIAYTVSEVNLDYIKERDYHSIKAVKIQELEKEELEDSAPFALPIINSYTAIKPIFLTEKIGFGSNLTVINRKDGINYRRASFTPEVKIPFNLHGNIFELESSIQNDFYSLENTSSFNLQNNQNIKKSLVNQRPILSASWRLPLIKTNTTNTIIIEPIIKTTYSSYTKNFSLLDNEDSNSTELSSGNLFATRRIAGFDRNEAGQNLSYGLRSNMFNQYGKYGLNFGQSINRKHKIQDIEVLGFSDNKSNYVGDLYYQAAKYFDITYSFQLNQSNFSNDINQVTTNLNLDRISISNNYLLIKSTPTNTQRKEQTNFGIRYNVTKRLSTNFSITRDLEKKQNIARTLTLSYDGCCTLTSLSISENNSDNLVKPSKSIHLIFSIKNM